MGEFVQGGRVIAFRIAKVLPRKTHGGFDRLARPSSAGISGDSGTEMVRRPPWPLTVTILETYYLNE